MEETAPGGRQKTSVELLVERIKGIQETLPSPTELSVEEQAFIEAAEEMYEQLRPARRQSFFRRR